MDEYLVATDANDRCNSKCQSEQECSSLWSLAQYYAYVNISNYCVFENKMKLDTDSQRRVKSISKSYARLFLEKEPNSDINKKGRFYWMALGSIAAKQVYCGVLALGDCLIKTASMFGAQFITNITTSDLEYMRSKMIKGNLWLYLDIQTYHEYYIRWPKSFFACLSLRDAHTYHQKIQEYLLKTPYISALSEIKYFKYDKKYLLEGFRHIQNYEVSTIAKDKKNFRFKSLLRIADHEQRVVLQNCFYAPNGVLDPTIKRIFDSQKELESRFKIALELASYFVNTQGRQAVFTNSCSLLNYPYKASKKVLDQLKMRVGNNNAAIEKFYEDMHDDENLYDVNHRMKFITRIAKEFDYVMNNYPDVMDGYLNSLSMGQIIES